MIFFQVVLLTGSGRTHQNGALCPDRLIRLWKELNNFLEDGA